MVRAFESSFLHFSKHWLKQLELFFEIAAGFKSKETYDSAAGSDKYFTLDFIGES